MTHDDGDETQQRGWIGWKDVLLHKKNLRLGILGTKGPWCAFLSRASNTLANIRTPVLSLNVQMFYIAFIYNSKVSGRACKKFYRFLFSWLKRHSAFMTSHKVPFSYTAADVEVVSCLSLSLWEASFMLHWEEVTQVQVSVWFSPAMHWAPPAPLSSV